MRSDAQKRGTSPTKGVGFAEGGLEGSDNLRQDESLWGEANDQVAPPSTGARLCSRRKAPPRIAQRRAGSSYCRGSVVTLGALPRRGRDAEAALVRVAGTEEGAIVLSRRRRK